MERVLADSGFVVALTNSSDKHHTDVVAVYQQCPKILLPQLTLVEVAYLIGRDAGIPTVISVLKGLPASKFEVIESSASDIERAACIIEQYMDSKVDFVDASIMAIAERLKIKTILTVDQRDFRLFRPTHCQSFTIRP